MARRADPELRARWRGLIEAWSLSSLTVVAFCNVHGISTAAFYSWRRKLMAADYESGDRAAEPNQDAAQSGSFLPVELTTTEVGDPSEADTQTGSAMVRIVLPSEIRIEVPASDRALVLSVISALIEVRERSTTVDGISSANHDPVQVPS